MGSYNAVDSTNNQMRTEVLYGDEYDADYELSRNYTLHKLRKVSSSLIKNNPIASTIQLAFVNSIFGGDVKVKPYKKNKELDLKALEMVKLLSTAVDKNREKTLSEFLEMITTSSFEKGDVLISLSYDKSQKVGTYANLIEGGRVQTPPHLEKDSNIREGVVYKKGRVAGYWVRKLEVDSRKYYLGKGKQDDYTYMPKYSTKNGKKKLICTLFKSPFNERPDQSRGVPPLTPVMDLIRYFMDYLETIIIQARVSASFCAFVTSSQPQKTKDNFEGKGNSNYIQDVARIKPGSVFYLKRGDRVDFASPSRPSDNTDQFIKRLLRMICSNFRMPYEFIYYDLGEVSYSSWRGASIELRRTIYRWQRALSKIAKWIMENMLEEVYLKGALSNSRITLTVKFPSYEILDEEKTARANKTDILQTKIKSKRDACDEQDKDYEELQKELESEAIDAVRITAATLIEMKKLEAEHDIIFPETVQEEEGKDRKTTKREGELEGDDTDEDDKKDRRKDDGNF